jgi:hypothetical protein
MTTGGCPVNVDGSPLADITSVSDHLFHPARFVRDDFDAAFRELLAVGRVGIERPAAQRSGFLFEVVVREEEVGYGEATCDLRPP